MNSNLANDHQTTISAGNPPGEPSIKQRNPVTGPKTLQLIRMLSGGTGADATAISRKLGWQPHSTRAAIAGLRKAGFDITFEKGADGKPGRYRITATPNAGEGSRCPVQAWHC